MMEAAVFVGDSATRIERVPIPSPGPPDVLVRLEGTGVCASNLPAWEGRPWLDYPLAPGATVLTSAPTASTTPQPSCPGDPGAAGYWNHERPCHTGRLDAQTPLPSTATRTSCAEGCGTGTRATEI